MSDKYTELMEMYFTLERNIYEQLEKISKEIVEIRVILDNHLKSHEKLNKWLYVIVSAVLPMLVITLMKLIFGII